MEARSREEGRAMQKIGPDIRLTHKVARRGSVFNPRLCRMIFHGYFGIRSGNGSRKPVVHGSGLQPLGDIRIVPLPARMLAR
jgi:hypothetical protein